MNRLVLLLLFLPICGFAQAIFAHNDYAKSAPFYHAFKLRAQYIEADVFLRDDGLMVAHERSDIDRNKTLQSMYLDPLVQRIDSLYGLTLMIDLKTEGAPTLAALVKVLDGYPQLTGTKNLSFTISGSYPPPNEWQNYPEYITFDGRPWVSYTPEQLRRVALISTNYSSVSSWGGRGQVPPDELQKLRKVIDEVHKLGKPVRFWGSPDHINAWEKFIAMGIDVLNTDHVDELTKYLSSH